MSRIIIYLLLGCMLPSYGQSQEQSLRKIIRDYLVATGEMDANAPFYSEDPRHVLFPVYDATNKENIIALESVPNEAYLTIYIFKKFSPHAPMHIMLVKNGEYEIIDMTQSLDDILRQLLSYHDKHQLTTLEFLQTADRILFLEKSNILNNGGAPSSKEAVALEEYVREWANRNAN